MTYLSGRHSQMDVNENAENVLSILILSEESGILVNVMNVMFNIVFN